MTAVLGMFALAGFSQVKWDAKFGMNFSNMTKIDESKGSSRLYFGSRYGLMSSMRIGHCSLV